MQPLFRPFRALGYISDDVPFAVQRRGKETFVTVSVGKAWQVYSSSKLGVRLVGPQFEHNIKALASHGDLTFAAVKSDIVVCRRLHRVGTYSGHTGRIIQLLSLGDVLLSLGDDRKLLVWAANTYDAPKVAIQLPEGFTPTCMGHPDTYLNKIVIGSREGKLQLWNFATGKMLYEFTSLGDAAVQCIAPSPALDVVGLGMSDGRAVLLNLKYNETIASFFNAAGVGLGEQLRASATKAKPGGGACSCIAFRTGGTAPLMAAGGGAGVITVWNLEEHRLHTIVKDAHDGPLTSLYFFPGEPLLMSGAADNSLKQWLFDSADGTARLLRFRSGHSAPPTCLKFYGTGNKLLSAGQDRAFRVFSVIQDQQSREVSQGHIAHRAKRMRLAQEDLKLPHVIAMDACQVREKDWCNVITAHHGDSAAYTWRLQNFTLGEHVLKPPKSKKRKADKYPEAEEVSQAPVTAVGMSQCGNYGLVGRASGSVDRYNMQSGLHRGSYTRAGQGKQRVAAHHGSVTGVAADACNKVLVSAGLDGQLCIWDFKRQRLQGEVGVGSGVACMAHHPATSLVALAGDDLVLRMYDVEAMRMVRRFKGHKDRVTGLVISQDARWLLSSSMDGTVRVWDIPAASCLQVVKLGWPVTGVQLSPGQDLLATCHVKRRGIYLWYNHLMFGSGADIQPSTLPVSAALPTIATGHTEHTLPNGRTLNGVMLNGGPRTDSDPDSDSDEFGQELATPDLYPAHPTAATLEHSHKQPSGAPQPLEPELVTLSLLPRSQWQTLVHLDAIKARSKPVQPPKKPASAPFFLPTVAGLHSEPLFDPSAADEARTEESDKPSSSSRINQSAGQGSSNCFTALLAAGDDSGDYSQFVALLRSMSPTAIDQEVRALEVLDVERSDAELAALTSLLRMVKSELASNSNFEFIQAVLKLLLQIHGDVIMQQPDLQQQAKEVQVVLANAWSRIDQLLQSSRCMLGFFGNLQT
ncbi:hypothetical protein ABBQ32_002010 [Trebouxia sp. C0010 RCD-2024]